MRRLPWDRILSLFAFALAMGYLEAVVVVYIRHLAGLAGTSPHLDYRALLPTLPPWLIRTEISREAATLAMLVGVALAAGRTWRERLCVFLLTFGVWDIVYYAGLKILLDWPASLRATDLLFLIPHPWFAPVWLPVVISLGMIVVSLALYPPARAHRRRG